MSAPALGAPPTVRVLHLEDSALDADLVCEFLRMAGAECEIHRVWTREDFVAALREKNYDLILADHALPAFDGEAALEIARVAARHVPFVFVSGTLGEDVAVEAMKRGATDYVVKQRLDRLPMVVTRALAEAAERAERKRAEKALRESEDRFRVMADSAPALIWVNGPDGACQFVNDAYTRFFGRTREEVLGFGWAPSAHPEDQNHYVQEYLRTVRKRCRFEAQARFVSADGSYRWLHSTGEPRFDDDGNFIGHIGISIDVTEQREAQEELRRLNETLENRVVAAIADREKAFGQLAELQKLETLGQLTGGVAHDFNNLLTPIVGSLDLLRRHHSGDERSQRLIAAALQGAERAKTLVARLLAFARRQVLEPRAVDVPSLIEGMTELVGRSLGPQIEIATDLPAGLPAARVDPNQLELALLNLAVNARDAMAGGGKLTIAADEQHVGPDHPAGLRHGAYVRLSVADTGMGMDASTLKRAVEPFFSTKGIGKGTGLGLSMVHGLAAQSGGALLLSSAPGLGTRAEIWLPVATEEAGRAGAGGTSAVPRTRSATILLVDDEELVRMATADMLADLGHKVVEASSGARALELLREGVEPDLVVTDYLMPGMTGADLAAEIIAMRPGTKVLLATGYANLAGHQMANLPLLPKPFRQAELAVRIAELIEPGGQAPQGRRNLTAVV